MLIICKESFKILFSLSNIPFKTLNSVLKVSKRKSSYRTLYTNIILCKLKHTQFDNTSTNEEHEEIATYDYKLYLKLNRPAKARTQAILCELLNLTPIEAFSIVQDNPELSRSTVVEITDRFKMCQKLGLETEIIIKCPWVLVIPEHEFKSKIELIKMLPLDMNITLPLIKQKNTSLLNMIRLILKERNIPEGNRIIFLSRKLKCSPADISAIITKYPFVQKVPFQRLESILNILLDKGMESKYILQDVWVFNYRPESVKQRLQQAIDAKVKTLKPWMVRCKRNIYEKTLKRQQSNHMILGDNSTKIDYLSERLDLSYETSEQIIHKHPEIKRMNISKMKEIFDFLFYEGFTPEQVGRWPRILCSKLETVKTRLKLLRSINFTPTSLVVFSKSQKQFDKYFEVISKKCKKE